MNRGRRTPSPPTSAWCGASQLDVGGEGVLLPLFIPLLNPSIGADCLEVLGKELARLIILALNLLAAVEVNIVLPAVPCLVLVGEPWVEGNGLHSLNSCHGFYRTQETLL